MIVGGQTEARAQLSSTIIDYHEPFDQGLTMKNKKQVQKGSQKLFIISVFLSRWNGWQMFSFLGAGLVIDVRVLM